MFIDFYGGNSIVNLYGNKFLSIYLNIFILYLFIKIIRDIYINNSSHMKYIIVL